MAKTGQPQATWLRLPLQLIIGLLKQAETSLTVAEIFLKSGLSDATHNKQRARFGDMEASVARRLRELPAKNAQLKSLLSNQPDQASE